jgi:hypothetical protein
MGMVRPLREQQRYGHGQVAAGLSQVQHMGWAATVAGVRAAGMALAPDPCFPGFQGGWAKTLPLELVTYPGLLPI